MFRLRLLEQPMPTGSKDPDVLLSWLLNSMGLIRRRTGQWGDEERGALHRIMRDALLVDPLRGWDTRDIGDASGLSNTGTHHQMSKLRASGLVSTDVDGKWHVHVLRGGSISAAVGLVSVQAKAVLEVRLAELSEIVVASESRMETGTEEEELPFSIQISEPGARREGEDRVTALVNDLGLGGERSSDHGLAKSLLTHLAEAQNPLTIQSLSERLSESRSRIQTAVDRMRGSGLVERVPMIERIAQDVFSGLVRQNDARGEEWLMTRGGLSRLNASVSKKLIEGVSKGTLDISKVAAILSPVPLGDQRILLNTLGGRMPFGIRLAGEDSAEVSERIFRLADRTLRRLRTVAQRLDSSLG